ncbi:MAG: hypothetical protein ACOVO1_12400 [Chitinophagaceae bacterium]
MERVHTLINKLKEQLDAGENAHQLLPTTQLLLGELQGITYPEQQGNVTVQMPYHFFAMNDVTKDIEINTIEVEVKTNEPEIIKVEAPTPILTKPKEVYNLFIDDTDVAPTLTLQNNKDSVEINDLINNDSKSFNDIFKENKKEISSTLVDSPVKDLRKAIGINEKYIYISELFHGDEAMYERSIKTINGFSVYPEAEQWIKRELFTKLCWEVDSEIVKQFDQLVRRRFA